MYLEAYRRNARLMALLEQLATVDERFADMRKQRSDAFVRRNARAIRRLQRSGQADQELDLDIASLAISSMVSRTVYAIFVTEGDPLDLEPIVQTLSRLWANALRIAEPDGEARRSIARAPTRNSRAELDFEPRTIPGAEDLVSVSLDKMSISQHRIGIVRSERHCLVADNRSRAAERTGRRRQRRRCSPNSSRRRSPAPSSRRSRTRRPGTISVLVGYIDAVVGTPAPDGDGSRHAAAWS